MLLTAERKNDSAMMLSLAFPAIVTQLSATLVQAVDTMFIGRISPLALGAAAVTGVIIFNITAVGDGFSTGLVASISRMIGRNNRRDAAVFATTGTALLTLIGALFTPLLLIGAGGIFRMLQIPPELEQTAWDYYSVFISFVPAIYAFGALSACFRARGDTKTPMLVGLGINILNIGLDWLLIFGKFGFPEMGVAGAALASGLSFVAGSMLLLVISVVSAQGLINLKLSYLSLSHFIRIIRIGVPSMLERFAMSFSQLLVMSLAVTQLGSLAIASFHIVMRLASLSFMPGFGFAMATATLTGQHLGADDPEGAERMIWMGIFQCGLLMLLISVIYFTLASPLISLFTGSAEIIEASGMPLRIYAIMASSLAPAMVARGGLQGAGDTAYTLKVMIVSRFIIRLPAAWALGVYFGFGLSGVWFAMCLDFVIRGITFMIYTRRGRWKNKRI